MVEVADYGESGGPGGRFWNFLEEKMMVVNGFSCVIGYEQAWSWSIDYAVVMLLEHLLERSKCL